MNRVKSLVRQWEQSLEDHQVFREVPVSLNAHDYARISALSDLYPEYSREQIIHDLLSAALDEIEEAMPYIPGQRVVSEDDHGDPVYEDIGLTPRFVELTRRYMEEVSQQEHVFSGVVEPIR